MMFRIASTTMLTSDLEIEHDPRYVDTLEMVARGLAEQSAPILMRDIPVDPISSVIMDATKIPLLPHVKVVDGVTYLALNHLRGTYGVCVAHIDSDLKLTASVSRLDDYISRVTSL